MDGSLASTGWFGGLQDRCAQGLPEVSGRRRLSEELCVWGGAWVVRPVSPAEEGQRVQGRGELGLHPADGMGTPLPVAILSP